METLKIDTSQNIEIEYTIASIGERIAASLLDLMFISGYSFLIGLLSSVFEWRIFVFIAFIPVGLYDLISEVTMNGQTWGKQIMKIKVVKLDGTQATFTSYFLRWVIRLVEIMAFFGSLATICIIINKKGQRIGDIAANTTVIRLSKKNIKPNIYTPVADDYQPFYPQAAKLSIDDIYTIKEVAGLLESNPNVQTVNIAQKARQAIEQKLGIKSDKKLTDFFNTLLNDYNYFNKGI